MSPTDKQNAGVRPGASRNQLGGWLQKSHSPLDRQTQLLMGRFRLSKPAARRMANLCFGEAAND